MADELYTYKRVLVNGEWGMQRVPAKGQLQNGAPVFPRVAPQIKAGEQPGAFSSMMDRLLNRQYYTTDTSSPPETTVHVPIVIDSDTLKQRGMLGKMLVARLNSYAEKGFKWIIEAESGPHGSGRVSMLNERLGQLFIVYFRHQEELARWAMGENVKPYRIERRIVPFTNDPGTDMPIPGGDDPVDFVITGGRPARQEAEAATFARMVELDEG